MGVGIFHEGLSKFGSEVAKNTPLPRIRSSHGGLSKFGFEVAKNTSPPPMKTFGLVCRALGCGD